MESEQDAPLNKSTVPELLSCATATWVQHADTTSAANRTADLLILMLPIFSRLMLSVGFLLHIPRSGDLSKKMRQCGDPHCGHWWKTVNAGFC